MCISRRMKKAASLLNRHAMKHRNPVVNPGHLSRAAGSHTINKHLLGPHRNYIDFDGA